MTNNVFFVCLLLFAVPLLASTAAAGSLEGELAAEKVSMTGDGGLTGGLRVITLRASDQSGADHALRVSGEMITVTTIHGERVTAVTVADNSANSAEEEEHEDAQLLGLLARPTHRFFLASSDEPEAQIALEFEKGHLIPADDKDAEEHLMFEQDREKMVRQTDGAVELEPAGPMPTVEVQGDFVFSVWEWDLVVYDDGQSTEYRSGEERDDIVSPPEVRGVGTSHMRHVQVTVQNGTLTLEPGSVSESRFVVTADSAHNDGVTLFHEVAGTLRGLESHEGDLLRLDGAITLSSITADGAVRGQVSGDLGSIDPADQAFQFVYPDGLSPAWVAGGVLILLAIGFGTGLVLMGSPSLSMADLERAFERRRYMFVARNADRFLKHPRFAPAAAKMKAISLLALRRPQAAGRFLARLESYQQPDMYVVSYLRRAAESGALPTVTVPDPEITAHLGGK